MMDDREYRQRLGEIQGRLVNERNRKGALGRYEAAKAALEAERQGLPPPRQVGPASGSSRKWAANPYMQYRRFRLGMEILRQIGLLVLGSAGRGRGR